MSAPIKKPCPKCNSTNTIQIEKNHIECSKESCSFSKEYNCPICDDTLANATYHKDDQGEFIICGGCKASVHLRRLANLIENGLQISKTTLCEFCNGPTVHRTQSNIGHRCLFFPKCSGQANLFGESAEELVFLDFETSGLEIGKDFITEIGALKIDKEGFEHNYQTLINIPVPLSQRIIDITGITDDILAPAPKLEEVLDEFVNFLGDAKIVAHNADFDIPWLMVSLLKGKKPLLNNKIICTLKWAKASEEGKCSLGALTKKYNIGHKNAHRALADAAATKEIFFILESKKAAERTYQDTKNFHAIGERIVKQYETFGKTRTEA
jgi:DNA polymerase III epsilon subunit family exonuclease